MFDIDQYNMNCKDEAAKWVVSPNVHSNDFIFRFLIDNPSFKSKEEAVKYYFEDGHNSAKKLREVLNNVCLYDGEQEIRLLEFASGYGCVTRHLKNVLPSVSTTSCDIHHQAVEFINNTLNTNAVLSSSIPEDLLLGQQFDAVFALSFFSHMPKVTFSRWLRKLASFTKTGGYLIFTTHGIMSRKFIPDVQFDQDGFYFQPASEQKDLDASEYGLTCTLPRYVFSQVFEYPEWDTRFYHEGFWWNHQDIYVLRIGGNHHNEIRRDGIRKRIVAYINNLGGQ